MNPMSPESEQAAFEWADKIFQNTPDVEPKYRDLLAMLAAAMMGNPDAAKHFHDRAVADGANAAELKRMTDLAQAQNIKIGDLAENLKQPEAGDEPDHESHPD